MVNPRITVLHIPVPEKQLIGDMRLQTSHLYHVNIKIEAKVDLRLSRNSENDFLFIDNFSFVSLMTLYL